MSAVVTTLHGTLVVIGEDGVLILGASGRGKSSLAMALIARAGTRGHHAGLVGDDRIRIMVRGGRLVGRGHPVIAGRIEARGVGLLDVKAAESAVIRAVVQLDEAPARLPQPADRMTEILGTTLPQLRLRPDSDLSGKADLVLDWMAPHFAFAKNS